MRVVIPGVEIYKVVAHEAEEGGFWGEVVGLPGCVSQGETMEEFRHNIREAIEAVLDTDVEDARIEFRLEPTLAEKDTLQFSVRAPYERLVSPVEESQTWTVAS